MSASLLAICLLGCSFLQAFSQDRGLPESCENENGGCEHFCHNVDGDVQCACADGYFLAADNQSCNSNEDSKSNKEAIQNASSNTFKCGAIIADNIQRQNRSKEEVLHSNSSSRSILQTGAVHGQDCPPGQCPWQALLINEDGVGFCGGTVLSRHIVLTAAHCVTQTRYLTVRFGVFNSSHGGGEALHVVDAIVTHHGFSPETYSNDIALVKLATPLQFSRNILPACLPGPHFQEKVLMKQPEAMVSGFGRLGEAQPSIILQRRRAVYLDQNTCMDLTQQRVSLRMFCTRHDSLREDSFQGEAGSPHVTRYRDTFFLTGIQSWGHAKYGVFTQVSKYLLWIREGIKKLTPNEKNGTRVKRRRHAIKWFYM